MRIALKAALIFLVIACPVSGAFAQEAIKPRPSPTAIVTIKYEDTYVKVTYSQPHKRGRDIFGKLVPYGEIWRTGANEATEITLTESIRINGTEVEAGTYAIFTIPEEDSWTIILNDDLGQWGSYAYTKDSDVLRFNVPVTKLTNTVWEPFTIAFEQNNSEAEMQMMWDDTMVSIPIKFLEH
jgi:hypothetical protein